ncbi:hypothetical protein [Cryptosporangium sp. NPDC051539]|uniref:hypothetical protein n=1 Tax=Cryptosporangium sp. NPDC051539 TaxID=3363962 RepID=UPI0037927375
MVGGLVALVVIGVALVGTVLVMSGNDGPSAPPAAQSQTTPAAADNPPAAAEELVTCGQFVSSATTGTPLDGLQPIAWTTRILEDHLAADGKPVPARVEATSEFFKDVIARCYGDSALPAEDAANAVYLYDRGQYA